LAQKLCGDLQTDLSLSLIYGTPIISRIFVPKYGIRIFFIRSCEQTPILLFAMGSDGIVNQAWDEDKSIFKAEISVYQDVQVNVTLYFPTGKPSHIFADGQDMNFVWDNEQRLAFFNVISSKKTITIEAQRID